MARLIAGTTLLILLFLGQPGLSEPPPSIDDLLSRDYLDDYYANVVLGYKIVTETNKYAGRYTGNNLTCQSCHLEAGTKPEGIPLYVAGMYPKYRMKNGRRNSLNIRIQDCFAYSMNGIQPPPDSPEILSVAAYVHYISYGQVIGQVPPGRGIPRLPDTGSDPNAARGSVIYKEKCQVCHAEVVDTGISQGPPVFGMHSFNAAAGLSQLPSLSGFIWANMPKGNEKSLSYQQALDVAAYIKTQPRPADPRKGKLFTLGHKLIQWLSPRTKVLSNENPKLVK